MTMPVDHDSEPSRLRFKIKLRQIVQDIDRNAADLDHFSLRQSACPRSFVDVSADYVDRCNRREFVEDFGRANIAGVNDLLGSTQRCESFRTKQAMRVRDDADEDGSSQFSVSNTGCGSSDCSFLHERVRLPSTCTCRKSLPLRPACARIQAMPASAPNPG